MIFLPHYMWAENKNNLEWKAIKCEVLIATNYKMILEYNLGICD